MALVVGAPCSAKMATYFFNDSRATLTSFSPANPVHRSVASSDMTFLTYKWSSAKQMEIQYCTPFCCDGERHVYKR
eukprot:scaffold5289_cov107-Cylindrotheca_fusiformis.AAC.4